MEDVERSSRRCYGGRRQRTGKTAAAAQRDRARAQNFWCADGRNLATRQHPQGEREIMRGMSSHIAETKS